MAHSSVTKCTPLTARRENAIIVRRLSTQNLPLVSSLRPPLEKHWLPPGQRQTSFQIPFARYGSARSKCRTSQGRVKHGMLNKEIRTCHLSCLSLFPCLFPCPCLCPCLCPYLCPFPSLCHLCRRLSFVFSAQAHQTRRHRHHRRHLLRRTHRRHHRHRRRRHPLLLKVLLPPPRTPPLPPR